MKKYHPTKVALIASLIILGAMSHADVPDEVIAKQREALAKNTQDRGFGPQSPRDINSSEGHNQRVFGMTPQPQVMNLCDIHLHAFAEHRGGNFTTYAGNGDGYGHGTGYKYDGELSAKELAPLEEWVNADKTAPVKPGDTIEVHYVYTTAEVKPGPTLLSCLSTAISNPQLSGMGYVFVLVNDENALDFMELTQIDKINGYYQAINMPTNAGTPIKYLGSTTSAYFNEQGSPFQVSWHVHPRTLKVDARSVIKWLDNNIFEEGYAHSVRNLILDKDLLSKID